MKVKIKRLSEDAVIPEKAHPTDAGIDLTATSMRFDNKSGYMEFGTSLAIAIPKNHVGLIFPRSSISKVNMQLCNAVGVIDHGYSGEIMFRFKPTTVGKGAYGIGDRVGQLIIMPYPEIELVEVDDLEDSERGSGGFGSTNDLTKLPDVSIDGAGMVNNEGKS